MEKRYQKLIKNTAIFTVGSFGSRVLSFLIVPLYTFVLTTAEYGKIDLFSTAISLMLPFTTLLMQEALVRFVPANEVDKAEAVSNSFLVVLYGGALTVFCIPLYSYGFALGEYTLIYIVILFLNTYNTVFSQYLRASGKAAAFAVNGILGTAVLLGCNVVFLLGLRIGMVGYFYSMLISQFVCAVYITARGELFRHFSVTKVNIEKLKQMLRYSIPLIPNNLMWWIMNAGDKYVINYFLGDSANGIYSVAMKIPTIISLVYNIFMQAWQISAIEENNQEDVSGFYDSVFCALSAALGGLSAGIMLVVYPVFSLVLEESYLPAWRYVPLLCIAAIINCFATFAGTTYIITKKSSKAFSTTAVGAVVNLILNFLLISPMGLYGVALGTAGGYMVVMLMRVKDMKRDMQVTLSLQKFALLLVILCAESVCIIAISRWAIRCAVGAGALALVVLLYRRELQKMTRLFRR